MNPQRAENSIMTPDAYLLLEESSELRYEYIDGQVYAMVGSTINHNRITMNIAREFGNHLKNTPCETFSADIKLKLGSDYVYPDVVVDCQASDNMLTTPVLIVEVLSKSTRKKDTTKKLIRYINLPSLQEYVMIEQDFVSVQVLRRSNDWKTEYYYWGDAITFASINVTLSVEDIYERVENDELSECRQLSQSSDDINTEAKE